MSHIEHKSKIELDLLVSRTVEEFLHGPNYLYSYSDFGSDEWETKKQNGIFYVTPLNPNPFIIKASEESPILCGQKIVIPKGHESIVRLLRHATDQPDCLWLIRVIK